MKKVCKDGTVYYVWYASRKNGNIVPGFLAAIREAWESFWKFKQINLAFDKVIIGHGENIYKEE